LICSSLITILFREIIPFWSLHITAVRQQARIYFYHHSTSSIGSKWHLQIPREEAESMLPKVNSWRDTGDTPGRKNHQEEAQL
jgi:hypothetical protein